VDGAVSALGENVFTITGGGTCVDNGRSGVWTYLYAATGKIGSVLYFGDEGLVIVYLGKTFIERVKELWIENEIEFVPSSNTTGMQDTYNGIVIDWLE
jgi:hypothetical protein